MDEPNRDFNAMPAEEDEEDDMEANRDGGEYRPNPDLWAEGADLPDGAREYYGNDDAVDDNEEPIGWGQGAWNASPPRRTPSPRNRPNVGVGQAPIIVSTSGTRNSDRGPDRSADHTPPTDDVNHNKSSSGNIGKNGDDHNEGGLSTIGNSGTSNISTTIVDRPTNRDPKEVGGSPSALRLEETGRNLASVVAPQRFNPSLPVIHDAFEFTDDVDQGHTEIPVPTAVIGQNTPTPHFPTSTSLAIADTSGGAS